MVRAKLRLTSIKQQEWGGQELEFTAQYSPEVPEDQRFQKATPSASAKFQIDNPAAFEQFKIGDCYYVDFSPAPKA